MTTATISDKVMPSSLSTILQEFASHLVSEVGCTALGDSALLNRPAEIACHLEAVKVGLETGGVGDTEMCQRFCFGGEERSRA